MKTYTGKANTVDGAIKEAAVTALENQGPDAMIDFAVKEIKGLYGGIAGFQDVEVTIEVSKDIKAQLCGEVLEYKAYQSKGNVTLIAYGSHNSAGYKVYLQLKPIDIYPPQYALRHVEPSGPVLGVLTPFTVSANFQANQPVAEVIVEDAKGEHKIKVQQV